MRGRKPSLRLFSARSLIQVAPLFPGLPLQLSNQSTGLKRIALTDMTGEYRLAGLPTGNFTLRIEKEGFQTQVREGITLTSAAEVMVNLSLAMGGRQEVVTVSANIPPIDNTTSTVGGRLAERSLTELPLNGRDLFTCGYFGAGSCPNAQQCSFVVFERQGRPGFD